MKQAGQNQQTLPFFPLGILLLPGEKAPLRIFEPRYKQLISECNEQQFTIGVPYIKDGRISETGCEIRLDEIIEVFENGEMLIVVEGVSVFRVLDYQKKLPGKLYGGGDVEILHTSIMSSNAAIISLAEQLEISSGTDNNFSGEVDLLELAKGLNLNAGDKLHLLQMGNQARQEGFVKGLLELEKSLRRQKALLENRVQEN